MTIRVDAYTAEGRASGVLARPGALRAILEDAGTLPLDRVAWQALGDAPATPAGSVSIPSDDVLVAVGDDDPGAPVHAAWHHVRLESGPYGVEGELATLPGFDPGRALTRPSGEFLLLRDVALSELGRTEVEPRRFDHALINRYAVERVAADLMLGFFFPGAVEERVPAGTDLG